MENHIKILGVLPRIQYIANGENATFEFPFAIFKDENIQVYLGDVLQNSNTYTVSGAGQTEGGSITFSNAPEQGSVVTLYRNIDIERTTDFQEGGALRANALNYELDYQIACQQQIADNLNRSMVLPPYAVASEVDLTLPTPSAGKAIVWNSDGTNLENSTVEVNALESTLNGYKTAAETAASTAATKAGIASDKADLATQKAQLASDKADVATSKAQDVIDALATLTTHKTVIETYKNGSSWYRVWSDGWIEQGGTCTGTSAAVLVNLLKEFEDTNYFITNYMVSGGSSTNYYYGDNKLTARTVSSFTVVVSQAETWVLNWYACGY